MTRQYDVVVERDVDGYYVASVPALRDTEIIRDKLQANL